MVKVRIKASQESFDSRGEDKGDFVVPKPGYYVLTVGDCASGYTKDSDGNEDKKKPYLKFTYKITGVGKEEVEVKENYGNVWDYMSFSPDSEWKRAEVLYAFGLATEAFDDDVDTDESFLQRKVLARLKIENSKNGKQSKVGRLFPYGTDPAEEGDTTSGVDYGDGDGDVFGAEPEATGHTEGELEALDLKALGAILSGEFGGTPQDHIVKKGTKVDGDATKAAVVAAILSAQGGAADEGEDTDPF